MIQADTICALATAPVNAPIAVIRISGPDVLSAAKTFFSKPTSIAHRNVVHGAVLHNGAALDDVILAYYKAPNSYTGEDAAEIFCHGNMLVVRSILDMLHSLNIRLAEPGEFTKRAFLNGKMDLTEAEAVHSIISAKSKWEVNAALEQMHGSLKNAVNSLREKVILLKADIEAGIDFSTEDIEFVSLKQTAAAAKQISDDISSVLLRCRIGAELSRGIAVSLAGKPNAGKSSILNLLLGRERAIVSNIPGTTRDIISEHIQIAGLQVRISDTAGIGEAANDIERAGIFMSKKNIDEAAIAIVVLDATRDINDDDLKVLAATENKKRVILINKTDAAREDETARLEETVCAKFGNCIRFSAKTGAGLNDLEHALAGILTKGVLDIKESFIATERIIGLLEESLASANKTAELAAVGEQSEIIAFELNSLIASLGEITGEISPEDILDSVFSRFCIGK